MKFWLLILSILVVRRLVVMVRKILRYCIDTIIGIVVLLGLSITVLYFVVGWKPYIVESGSMESAIHTGSIVFVDTGYDFSDVEVDDVIAFTRVDGKAVTHRVVSIENGLLETKGDANKVSDGFTTNEDNFIGKSIFSVPGLGYIFRFFSSTRGRIVGVTAIIALFLLERLLTYDEDDSVEARKENTSGDRDTN